MKEKKPHVSGYKKDIVNDFAKLIKEYPIIGAVNMENLPAPQLQTMRRQLRGKVVMRMTKRRLMKIAIEQTKKDKKGIEELEKHLKGMPALLFSKENPFKLYKILKKSKSAAPAKAGQTAPKDIVIPAGPTPFAPGPIIGELGMIGVKTSVEGGKVAIQKDSVVVKEGEEIKANVAGMLTRMGINPMEIGLDLVAVYEDGTIYTRDILDIDEDKFLAQLQNAHRWSFNLAVEAGYFTKDTVELLVPKAFNEAKALALEADIMADAVAEELIAKAEAQGKSLKDEIKYEEKIGKAEEKKEEKPAEVPKEKKKEEQKTEEKKEAPKPEVKEEPKLKVEEKKPEIPKEEPKPKVEEKEEEKPAPEPKKEKPKPKPKVEKKQASEKVKTRAEELKEKLEKARETQTKIEVKQPKAEPQVKEEPRKSGIIRMSPEEKAKILEKRNQDINKAEDLFKQLQKKGTLRGVNQTDDIQSRKVIQSEKPSPEDIIKKALKK